MSVREVPTGRGAWATAAAFWSLATALSILLVDRPAASFSHAAFHGHAAFVALTHIVDPVLPAAAVGFLLLGSAALMGWSLPRAGRIVFATCTATLLAVIMKHQLKYAFGRTWPETWVADNPSWIRDGVMAFVPFHGGLGWTSFPSGHMALATAPAVVLLLALRSSWRWLVVLPVAAVAVGLYGADYHFPSDIMAGTMVGTVVAAISTRVLAPGGTPLGGTGSPDHRPG